MMSKFFYRTYSLAPIIFVILTLQGCASTPIAYKEVWNIKTEPPGAAIYINNKYIGEAPLTTTVTSDKAIWSEKSFFEEYAWLPRKPGTWTVRAVGCAKMSDGSVVQTDATEIAEVGDSVWDRAFSGLGPPYGPFADKSLPKEVTGQRNILLMMKRPPSEYEVANAEYEQALDDYKAKYDDLNLALTLRGLNRGLQGAKPGTRDWQTVLNAANSALQDFNVRDKQIQVELAYQTVLIKAERMRSLGR